MKDSKIPELDRLDFKIFSEMPILIDTLAAFGNKISRILLPMYDEVESIIKQNINEKKYWQIKQNKEGVFYPLTKEEYSTQTKIVQLDNRFILLNHFNIAKIREKKWLDYFIVEFGYWYQSEDRDYPQMNIFYFSLWKGDDYKNYGGILMGANFYKSAVKGIKQFEVEINHPNIDGEPECIEIRVPKLDLNKIQLAYKLYLKNVLKPALKSIK